MGAWMFASLQDGSLLPHVMDAPIEILRENVPDGYELVEGKFDHLSQRISFITDDHGNLTASPVDWIPPRPPDTELATHEWSAVIRRWVTIPTSAGLAAEAREKRTRLLAETDWSQGRDVPDELARKFQLYRQALRDIPAQPGFPLTIEWPQQPTP